MNPIEDFVVNAGDILEFTVTAEDPDPEDNGHLVYDIRHADSGNLANEIDFNGLSGDFRYSTQAEDVGTYYLKAIAKDGKGGIGEREFKITIIDPDRTAFPGTVVPTYGIHRVRRDHR